uniref:Chitin-binding protein n=1 Tax=Holotrichia parallela TaxID=93412 RepID=A0A088BU36_HOLPA|nr:chitin-binding protein [Holotrichia parallela]
MKVFLFLSSVLLAVHFGEADPIGLCPVNNGASDILLADTDNCAIYYQCDWGDYVVKDCPPSLYFNTLTDNCDYLENVNCDRSSTGETTDSGEVVDSEEPIEVGGPIGSCPAENPDDEDVLLPDSENCAVFYKCDWGEPVLQECPDDLLFNIAGNVCDWAENVDCDRDNIDVESGEESGESGSSDLLFDCPESEALYIPHKTDCAKYYVCVYGKPVEYTCPEGLHYDGKRWICDYAEEVTCGVYAQQECASGDDDGGSTGSGAVGSCPEVDGEEDVLLPDAENCAIFYKCAYGAAVLQACPSGLYFNSKLDVCDWPENVDCDRDDDSDESSEDPETGDATGPLVECPAEDGKYATYIPDKTDCTKYYVCVHGVPVINTCADGLYYDGTIWACTYKEDAKCGVYKPIEEDPSVSSEEGTSGESSGNPWVGECPAESEVDVFLASKDDPHKFYVCVGTTPVELECPSNLVFDLELQRCEYDEGSIDVPESNEESSEDPETGNATGPLVECPAEDGTYATYIPDKTDCTKYYVCVHGVPVINTCADGLYYDGTIWACTYKEDAKCGVYKPIEEDPSVSSEEGTSGESSGNPWVGECPVESEVDVFLASKDDPHKFYVCVGTTPVELECPSDLVFDFELQRCEYA